MHNQDRNKVIKLNRPSGRVANSAAGRVAEPVVMNENRVSVGGKDFQLCDRHGVSE